MASLERLYRGDLKASPYSFELDLSLRIWPLRSSVQRISIPLCSGQNFVCNDEVRRMET